MTKKLDRTDVGTSSKQRKPVVWTDRGEDRSSESSEDWWSEEVCCRLMSSSNFNSTTVSSRGDESNRTITIEVEVSGTRVSTVGCVGGVMERVTSTQLTYLPFDPPTSFRKDSNCKLL